MIVHEPTRPVRPDVLGEVVFLSEWQKLNQTTAFDEYRKVVPYLWVIIQRSIFSGRHTVTQREATVAASFIKWLGTGVGSCFLTEMYKKKAKTVSCGEEQDTCVSFWAQENCMRDHSGLRRIEFILAKDEDYASLVAIPYASTLKHHINYTSHDLDVIECVVAWLATEAGTIFVEMCQKKVDIMCKVALKGVDFSVNEGGLLM